MALSYCGITAANTGQIDCDKSRGTLVKLAIDSGSIDSANLASATLMQAELVRRSKLSKTDADKLFILPVVQDIALNNEQNTTGSLNQGYTTVIREGRPSYTVKVFAGADLLKRLRNFNNQTVRIYEYDSNGVWWGTKSSGNARGYQAKLFFTGNDIATGQNVEEGVITMTVSILSNTEYKDNCYYFDLSDQNVEDIVPLIDVTLTYVSHSSNVLSYSVTIPGANGIADYDVAAEYGTEIAALAASFSAKSGAGTPTTSLAITSMAYNSTTGLLEVTYNSGAYGSATGNIKLIPPTPAQLDSGDVPGIEILSVTHAKP